MCDIAMIVHIFTSSDDKFCTIFWHHLIWYDFKSCCHFDVSVLTVLDHVVEFDSLSRVFAFLQILFLFFSVARHSFLRHHDLLPNYP